MHDLHLRVNPQETILGWYTAGPGVSPSSAPLHTFFSQDTTPFRPIQLTIDTEMLFKSDDVGMRAYTWLEMMHLDYKSIEADIDMF